MKPLNSISIGILIIASLPFSGMSQVTEIDGNTHKTVLIGTQVWMAENLRTTKYNDGTLIPLVTENKEWNSLETPGFCWYDNEQDLSNAYGALYNWYSVNTGKLCPIGWHVPSDVEWAILISYLGDYPGGKLKDNNQGIFYPRQGLIVKFGNEWEEEPNPYSTDQYSFTALPGGFRGERGRSYHKGLYGTWWSSTEKSSKLAWHWGMERDKFGVYRRGLKKKYGMSIRCIKD